MSDFNTILEDSVKNRANNLTHAECAVFLFFKANNVLFKHDADKAQHIVDRTMEHINSEKCDEWRNQVATVELETLRGMVCKIVGHSVHSNMDNWLDFLAEGKIW